MTSRTSFVAILLIAGFASAGLQAVASQGMSSDYEKDAMKVQKQMMARMQMKPSGSPDKDFVMMMIPHHQGAVDMARLELKYGKDPQLRSMAEKMISDQEKEIAQMQAWQAKSK